MLISREYAKTVLSVLAQKLSGIYKKPSSGIPESDLADDVKNKLGGGVPDASELENGTILVVVDGVWTVQEGYGYSSDEESTTIDPELIPDVSAEDITFTSEYYDSNTVDGALEEIGEKLSDILGTKDEADEKTIDTVVTEDSTNLITSGAVHSAIETAIGDIDALIGNGVIV